MRLIAEHRAIDATLDWARRFAHDAKTALNIFPDGAIRKALLDVADYTVQRVR